MAVVLKAWEDYRDGKIDVVVPSLATNIAIDLVRQAEAEFEELVVRPKKYPASEFPVWTLPAVAYLCQAADFDKKPKSELVKRRKANFGDRADLDHVIHMHKDTNQPIGTEDLCFQSVFCGIRYHANILLRMGRSRGVPDLNFNSMRVGSNLPDKLFRIIELMPQYQSALFAWEDIPDVCKHDEISSGVQCLIDNPSVIPLWLTFGIELFLNIQTALGSKKVVRFAKSRAIFQIGSNVIYPARTLINSL